jgi:hypothetical protein
LSQVVLASGHLVDAPDRPAPRFPPHRVDWVTSRVRDALVHWRIGPGATVVSGGARGADIIIAEEGLRCGAQVVLCLALPPKEFRRRSVDLPGTDWGDRFERLRRAAQVRHLNDGDGRAPADDTVFARTNAWMVDVARGLDPRPYALIVWNGEGGDGPGGTADLIRRLGYQLDDPHLLIIDPNPERPGG